MTYHLPIKCLPATLLLAAIPLTAAAFTSTANATDNLRFLQTQEAYAIAYSNRGHSYYNKGQYDRAIANYDKAIKLDPKFAIAYNNRGILCYDQGDYEHAQAYAHRARADARPVFICCGSRRSAYRSAWANCIAGFDDFRTRRLRPGTIAGGRRASRETGSRERVDNGLRVGAIRCVLLEHARK